MIKALVVGLGSMGKRRIRLMRALSEDILIAGVDEKNERRKETADLFSVSVFSSLEEALSVFAPDVGFVCASPLAHADIINVMLSKGLQVFSEINLTDCRYDENIALAESKGLILFLSSTQMYRKEIEYITAQIKGKEKLRYRYHVGQYLPDWHPWESYTDFFVKDKKTNGCRELFAIELPWIKKAFGKVINFSSESGNLTSLDIEYKDYYAVSLTHVNDLAGQIVIDIVSRKAVRELEVFGEDIYLSWSGTPDTLYQYDFSKKQNVKINCYESIQRDTRYSENIIENAYIEEIVEFFSLVNSIPGNHPPRYSFRADKEVLKLINAIEKGSIGE